MNKTEREYIGRAVNFGCMLCRHLGLGETPAEWHHQRTGIGAGRRASHLDGTPLCPAHHRSSNEALHVMERRAWERHHNITEVELIQQTRELCGL